MAVMAAAVAARLAGGTGWAYGMAGSGTRVRAGWCGSVGRNCPLVRAGGRWRALVAGRGARSGRAFNGATGIEESCPAKC